MPVSRPQLPAALRVDHGYTLIELLVAMVLGVIVSLAAFSFLEFSTRDVAHTTDRIHVDQTGRTALENIMLELHSACVAPTVDPILAGSSPTKLLFVSETSPLNSNSEPVSELAKVKMHEIVFTGTKHIAGSLIEKTWPSSGTDPNYTFNTKEKPTERLLLNNVSATEFTSLNEPIVFKDYSYYQSGESGAQLGQFNPALVEPKTEKAAEEIAKVTVAFILAPEGKEGLGYGGDRPITLEDSAILRLATASEASENPNLACTQTT